MKLLRNPINFLASHLFDAPKADSKHPARTDRPIFTKHNPDARVAGPQPARDAAQRRSHGPAQGGPRFWRQQPIKLSEMPIPDRLIGDPFRGKLKNENGLGSAAHVVQELLNRARLFEIGIVGGRARGVPKPAPRSHDSISDEELHRALKDIEDSMIQPTLSARTSPLSTERPAPIDTSPRASSATPEPKSYKSEAANLLAAHEERVMAEIARELYPELFNPAFRNAGSR